VLFFPLFQPYTGLLLEQVLTILLTFVSLISLLGHGKRINIHALLISLSFMLLLVISILRSMDILIVNDLYELGKPIYFFLFFSMAYSVRWNNAKVLKYFSSLMFLLLIAALIGIGEGTSDIVDKLTSVIYKNFRPVLVHKAVFSFIITYTFATVLLLPIFYCFIRLLRPKNKTIIKDMAKFLIFLSCFALTQSRTIFISLLLTFAIFVLLILFNRWYPARNKVLFVFSILITIIVVSISLIISYAKENLSYLYGGLNIVFSNLENFSIYNFVYSNRSTSLRFDQIIFALEQQDPLPLIGVGIGKAILMPESLYAMYYYRTGLIGICMHFGLIFYTVYWSLFFTKRYARINFSLASIFFAIMIYFLSFGFCYFSSAVNDQTRSGFIFYVIIAIVCYYKKHYCFCLMSRL
jgi:hypothetical protein